MDISEYSLNTERQHCARSHSWNTAHLSVKSSNHILPSRHLYPCDLNESIYHFRGVWFIFLITFYRICGKYYTDSAELSRFDVLQRLITVCTVRLWPFMECRLLRAISSVAVLSM